MITTPWTKFFYEYLLEDEQELSVGEMLTVYFGTPNMFITLWSACKAAATTMVAQAAKIDQTNLEVPEQKCIATAWMQVPW
jgi:hypothetical protein